MHLLCFLAGLSSPELILARVRRVLAETMPEFPVALQTELTILPELSGGWLTMVPSQPGLRSRLSTHVGDDIALLFYGELFGVAENDWRQTVIAAWRSGGPDAVRDLDGCFSVLIVERMARRCTVVSDLIGRRSLRYAAIDGALLVATHDVALVATGLVSPRVDMTAVSSVASFGWSLGGKPLIEGVEACEPESVLQYCERQLDVRRLPRMRTEPAVGSGSRRRERDVVNAMIDTMSRNCAAAVDRGDLVKTDLTAGLDSRCVLALLIPAMGREKIIAGTEGEETDLDVVVAQRIAGKVGVQHVLDLRSSPEPEKFLERLDVLAFSSSGDTDGKRALTNLFQRSELVDPLTRFYGAAGENFRGGFYPSSSVKILNAMTFDGVVDHLVRVYSRLNSLVWREASTRSQLVSLLERRLRQYEGVARHPMDLLDFYYVFERFGRWGSFSARATWWSQYFAPFSSASLLHLWFQLPPPLGVGSKLHRAILRRYLPSCYYLPLVNDAWFAPLLRYPRLTDRLGGVWTRWGSRAARATRAGSSKRARATVTRATLDTWSANQILSTVRPVAERLLMSTGSITPRLFPAEQIEGMLGDLRRDPEAMISVGTLLTVERWREQIERTWALARQER
jgi:hypothetical protein